MEVVVEQLPDDYFEDTLILFGKYRTERFKITADYDSAKGSVKMVDAVFTDGTKNASIDVLSENEWNVEYDYWVTLDVTPAAGYRGAEVLVDGVFSGNSYVEAGETSFHFGFRFDQGKDVTVQFNFFE